MFTTVAGDETDTRKWIADILVHKSIWDHFVSLTCMYKTNQLSRLHYSSNMYPSIRPFVRHVCMYVYLIILTLHACSIQTKLQWLRKETEHVLLLERKLKRKQQEQCEKDHVSCTISSMQVWLFLPDALCSCTNNSHTGFTAGLKWSILNLDSRNEYYEDCIPFCVVIL